MVEDESEKSLMNSWKILVFLTRFLQKWFIQEDSPERGQDDFTFDQPESIFSFLAVRELPKEIGNTDF